MSSDTALPVVSDLFNANKQVIGSKVTCMATFDGSQWSAATGSGTFSTPGESCWAFGDVGDPKLPCDHFGVSTTGTPTSTTCSWLVEGGAPGTLVAANVAIPSVVFTPPPAVGAPVVAVIQTQRVDAMVVQNNAYWVKVVQANLPENADLNGDPSTVIRYEFFRDLGTFDNDGLVDPTAAETPHGNVLNAWVGNYVGKQIAGFNAVQAVPEPRTWMSLGGGLVLIAGLRLRRQRRSRQQS